MMKCQGLFFVLVFATLQIHEIGGFSSSPVLQFGVIGSTSSRWTTTGKAAAAAAPWRQHHLTTLKATTSDDALSYEPVFDFSNPDVNDTTSKFERIDDVIMGGVSSSALKQLPNELFARWSGICRIDGG